MRFLGQFSKLSFPLYFGTKKFGKYSFAFVEADDSE